MPSEQDGLQACKNQLIREREELLRKVNEIDEDIASISKIQEHRFGVAVGRDGELAPIFTVQTGRLSIRNAIRRWVRDAGKKPGDFFTCKEVTEYLKMKGRQGDYAYNSCFEALKRLVQKGELEKVKDGFKVRVNITSVSGGPVNGRDNPVTA
jgi:hypothetical protein